MQWSFVSRVRIELTQTDNTSKPILTMEYPQAVITSIALVTPSVMEGPVTGAKEIVTLRIVPSGPISVRSFIYDRENTLIGTSVKDLGPYTSASPFDSPAQAPIVPGVPSSTLSGGPDIVIDMDPLPITSATSFFEGVNIAYRATPTGFSTGPRTFSPFQITKAIDENSAELRWALTGKLHLALVKIELRLPGRDSAPIWRVTLDDATISSIVMAAPPSPGASLFDTPAAGGTMETVAFRLDEVTPRVTWECWTYDALTGVQTGYYTYTYDPQFIP